MKRVHVQDRQIRKIICQYDDKNILWGFQLIDGDGVMFFTTSYNANSKTHITTELQEGERIVGIRGRRYNNS